VPARKHFRGVRDAMGPLDKSKPIMTLEDSLRVTTDGRPLFVVSDLHLGPPAPFGFPAELEGALAGAVDEAARRGALVVLNGDILENGAGATPLAILAKYPLLLEALGDATVRSHVYYVVGNHDPDAASLRGVLPWTIATGLLVDDAALVVHGDLFDEGLRESAAGRAASLHARAERLLGARVDLPLSVHDSLRNRLLMALGGRFGENARRLSPTVRAWIDENYDYLVTLEASDDPRRVVATLAEAALPPGVRAVLAGHTHRPGIADVGAITYYNSGTWSPHMAVAVDFERGEGRVVDIVRGTTHGREAYARWQEPVSWLDWWSEARADLSPGKLVRETARTRFASSRPDARAHRRVHSANEDERMNVSFEERLQGTMWGAGEDEGTLSLDLRAKTSAALLRSCTFELEGTIRAGALVAEADAVGVLRLGARTWDYELSFVGRDGKPYRLLGQKRVRIFDLASSLTDLRGDVFDARGRSVATFELRFDLAKDLGPLLRGLTARAREDAPSRATPAPSDAFDDPSPIARAREAEGRWVAVTGAAGHVGFTLCRLFRQRGYEVLGIVRDAHDTRAAALRALGVELAEADVLVPASLRRALAGRTIDGLFHTAAAFKLWAVDAKREIEEPIVKGTLNVLRAAEEAGVRRVVYTSAGGAAGHDATGREPLNETDWNEARTSPYLRGKTEAEERAWEFAKVRGLDLVSVLPTAILGPFFHRHTPVTRLLEDVLENRIPLLPDFANSWVDVRDVARAQLLVYEAPAAHGRYIVSAAYRSWRAVIEELADLDGRVRVPARLPNAMIPLLPTFDGLRARLFGAERTLTRDVVAELQGKEPRYSSARLERELGWTPIAFRRTLGDTLTWLGDRASREGRAFT
jgi:dihydroflavonol-4-reductase